MATISDLRLITLLPAENQTIYAFNTENINEYYSESFFAKMGTTWAFCVVPDRIDNNQDFYVNIIQSDHQTITLNALIPDIATESEIRAGILNYYNSDRYDRYTYTIGYQNIRVCTTAVLKERLDLEYKLINSIQVDHQSILIVDSANKTYYYGVELPVNTAFKAILIAEPGYIPGRIVVTNNDIPESEPVEYEDGKIVNDFVTNNITITATAATEIYETALMKPWLFDNSTVDYSNSDGNIQIGVGTETRKDIKTILLYKLEKIYGNPYVQIGTESDNMLYAATGPSDHSKATRLIYRTDTQKRFILSSISGYYNWEYILGYSAAIKESSLIPKEFSSSLTRITVKGFGFCSYTTPVNDLTKGHWFLIIDQPTTPNWTYIKIMMFDNETKLFSMIVYKDYFIEIEDGQFIGELQYLQDSKAGINDSAYLFLKEKFDSGEDIQIGVFIY